MLKNLKARQAVYTFLSSSLLLIAFVASAGSAVAASAAVQVTVNVKSSLGTIPDTAFGLNTAAWDAHLLDPGVAQLLRQAGVNVLRFPGGSTADFYHWKTNTVTSTKYGSVNPKDPFDAFMKVASRAGARPMLTVNYGSNTAGTGGGDPQEAADWVRYANSDKHYGVRYWEVGNEVYGNGSYGAKWEVDLHKEIGPAAYAKNALDFIKAMKEVDPTIQVGLVLTAPGNWPDGSNPDWNNNVLSIACQQMDFAAVHWYPQSPGSETDSGLLSSTNQITNMVATLRDKINQNCGSHASKVKIMITETNSVNFNPGKQTVSPINGLFLADSYLSWLENGVTNIDWWGLHNGMTTGQNNSASLSGDTQYGDYGILSSGSKAPGFKEPPANTPFAPYYALQLLTRLASPGDHMLQASAPGQTQLTVHAISKKNGQIALLLINKDHDAEHPVNLALAGLSQDLGQFSAEIYSYGLESGSLQSTVHPSFAQTFLQPLSPYSMSLILLTPHRCIASA
ncbi:MAG TPA: cellulose-binding protein [Ktedonobacterales bacterium]|jgi:hypothetical protein